MNEQQLQALLDKFADRLLGDMDKRMDARFKERDDAAAKKAEEEEKKREEEEKKKALEADKLKAAEEKVEIRLHRIIYALIEEIQAAMKGMLGPTIVEQVLGQAEIRRLFKVSKLGTIAGCMVVDGVIKATGGVRVIRDGIVIYEGKLASLQREKDTVKEVKAGFECGMLVENFNDIKEGDIIECFEMVEQKE